MGNKSVLIITLPLGLGGVTAQNRMAADLLRRHGYSVDIAWRASYKELPTLSVPIWRAWRDRPQCQLVPDGDLSTYAVGTWLPEFEWAHYQAWRPWTELLNRHQRHVVISGNILPAWGLHRLGMPSMNWIATPYWPDRIDRVRAWSASRRWFDRLCNSAVTSRQERELVKSTDSWAISEYTRTELRKLSPTNRVRGIVVIPVDVARFHPADRVGGASVGRPLRVCFSGRTSDPRKGIGLLIDAFTKVIAQRRDVELHIYGDLGRADLLERYNGGKIADYLKVSPPVSHAELPEMLRRSDIFVLPSYQEGLSQIAAEAMASGCCVVSTRCGGPEEFVIDGETGLLAELDSDSLAERLLQAAGDCRQRGRLANNGVALIREKYNQPLFERQFMEAFSAIYG